MVRVQKENIVLSVPRADWEHYKINGYKPLDEELIAHEEEQFKKQKVSEEELEDKIVKLLDELKEKDKEILSLKQEITALTGEEHPDFDKLSLEELKEFARENDIDLGQATSENGVIKKIKEHFEETKE